METDEGEKEVPAKKPKTEPVLVRPSLDFKTESSRELSNFNFQWTKTLYQNYLKYIAFFLTFLKDLRCTCN